MGRSVFRLYQPFVISFSGGRTSGYLLRRVIDAYGGTLPVGCQVLFANTGKERDETLDFVHQVETQWNVPIVWLEWDDPEGPGEPGRFRVVNYQTAHRRSEPNSPFERMVARMPCLPNPLVRRCSGELKMRTQRRYLESVGWSNDVHRFHAIGIRADEEHRTIQIRADCPGYVSPVFPLVVAGVTESDVLKWWSKQDFDLQLRPHEGNCDLCFLKSTKKLLSIMREHPEFSQWWEHMETTKRDSAESGAYFRESRPYAKLVRIAQQNVLFDDFTETDGDEIACSCGSGVGEWSVEEDQ